MSGETPRSVATAGADAAAEGEGGDWERVWDTRTRFPRSLAGF